MRAVTIMVVLMLGNAVTQAAPPWLHTQGPNIVDSKSRIVPLRGVNLGGWMFPEQWMSPLIKGDYADVWLVTWSLDAAFGVTNEQELQRIYQQTWVRALDLDNIKKLGFNLVRVPVWWGNFFTLASHGEVAGFRTDAFTMLDWLVNECAARDIYVVIDMHAAVGGHYKQPKDLYHWNEYWTNGDYQGRTAWLWWQIANHYKSNPTVAGYDLLNEPTGATTLSEVWRRYGELYRSIRSIDATHIIIMEATGPETWSLLAGLPAPSSMGWTNVVYSTHEYQWPQADTDRRSQLNMDAVKIGAQGQICAFQQSKATFNVPLLIGEFSTFGCEAGCANYVVQQYNTAGISWSRWTYKTFDTDDTHWNWSFYGPAPAFDIRANTPYILWEPYSSIRSKWESWSTETTFKVNRQVVAPVRATTDIVWQNGFTTAAWQMRDHTVVATINLPTYSMALAGVGNFTNPSAFGHSDLVYRNDVTGETVFRRMNDDGTYGNLTVSNWTGATDWRIRAVADFNGDGVDDLLWRNINTGAISVWSLSTAGNMAIASYSGAVAMTTSFDIAAVADFDRDGRADILWRNDAGGATQIWIMNGGAPFSTQVPPAMGSSWHVAGAGDLNGDGYADVIWRDNSNMISFIWMNGIGGVLGTPGTATLPVGYLVKGTGDFNGDGRTDLVSVQNNNVLIWYSELVGGQTTVTPISTTMTAGWSLSKLGNFAF